MPRSAAPVQEVVVALEVDGRARACWSCSPDALDALAAGWLRATGVIRTAADLAALEVDALSPRTFRVRVRLAAPAPQVASAPTDAVRCDPLVRLQGRAARSPHMPALAEAAALLRTLFASMEPARTSGMHAAALSDGRRLHLVMEDVARHAAVDKVFGRALLQGTDTAGAGLVLSARVSGEIALKAAMAGVDWIASRSVPTTLALEVASRAGLGILARAGAGEATAYHADGRIERAAAEDG